MLPCGDRSSYAESFEAADAFARRWLDAPPATRPTAVLAKTDQIAIPLLSALHLRGVSVPADLSVMGYDNVPESGYTVPALTTVDNGIDARCAPSPRPRPSGSGWVRATRCRPPPLRGWWSGRACGRSAEHDCRSCGLTAGDPALF